MMWAELVESIEDDLFDWEIVTMASSEIKADEISKDVNFVTFNQDGTCVIILTERGFAIFNIQSPDVIEKFYENYGQQSESRNLRLYDSIVADRIFLSNFFVYVCRHTPRKLRVYHADKRHEMFIQSCDDSIRSVKINRNYLAVCMENSINLHDLKTCEDFQVFHTIGDIPLNENGIMDLSSTRVSYLAYPTSVNYGHVNVFDVLRLSLVNSISAHTSALAAVRFNFDARKLATASVRGTVIRVFNPESGERLYEFTRGLKRHNEDASWMEYLSKTATNYLPTQMNEIWLREKSFAVARLPRSGIKTVASLRVFNGKLHLLVATYDGILYCYPVESEGGDLTVTWQHNIGSKIREKPPIIPEKTTADSVNEIGSQSW